HDLRGQHDRYARWAAHAPSSSVRGWFVPPLDFSPIQPARLWPELIRGSAGEGNRPAADRREIVERVVLVLLTFVSAVAGGTTGRLARRSLAFGPIDGAGRAASE